MKYVMHVKRFEAVLIALFSLACCTSADEAAKPTLVHWGPFVEGVQAGLYFEQTSFKANEEIVAHVILTNTSSEAHWLPRDFFNERAFPPVTLIVVGPDRAPLVPIFKRPPGPGYMPVGRTLGAHEGITEKYRLRNRFDFLQSGDYMVGAKTLVWETNPPKPRKPIEITSDYVSVRVEGGPARERPTFSPPTNRPPRHIFGESLPESVRARMPIELQERTLARQRESVQRRAAYTSNVLAEKKEGTAPQMAPPPLAVTWSESNNHNFPISRRTVLALVALLTTAILAILWRAARRKPEAQTKLPTR